MRKTPRSVRSRTRRKHFEHAPHQTCINMMCFKLYRDNVLGTMPDAKPQRSVGEFGHHRRRHWTRYCKNTYPRHTFCSCADSTCTFVTGLSKCERVQRRMGPLTGRIYDTPTSHSPVRTVYALLNMKCHVARCAYRVWARHRVRIPSCDRPHESHLLLFLDTQEAINISNCALHVPSFSRGCFRGVGTWLASALNSP